MQIFAVNGLGGSLVTLLYQAAIPTSMVITRLFLKTKYSIANYIGAAIVVAGILVVLLPTLLKQKSGGDLVIVWSGVLILSCIPMTFSSVYKEKALGEQEIDVVYLNGWVAVFQFIFSMAVAVPSAFPSNIPISQLPENVWNGMRCYAGYNSIMEKHTYHDIVINRDECARAPVFVTTYMGFNVLYNIFIILILKYGSSNELWLALTIMVPVVNVAFSLKFMPGHQPLKQTDIIGLIVIMLGLVTYRFWPLFQTAIRKVRASAAGGSSRNHTVQ